MRWPYALICGSMAAATVLGALLLAYPLQDGPAAASTGQAEPCDAPPDGLKVDVPGTWRTTNISDVADHVKYTIRGTILEIRDPVG